jgi:hypothetical protein
MWLSHEWNSMFLINQAAMKNKFILCKLKWFSAIYIASTIPSKAFGDPVAPCLVDRIDNFEGDGRAIQVCHKMAQLHTGNPLKTAGRTQNKILLRDFVTNYLKFH